jgi:Zn-dependent protease with chaperone function
MLLGLAPTLLFGLLLTSCAAAMATLARARWTWHAPRVAILSWQALGLGFGLALIGLPLSIGLAPYGPPTAPALWRFLTDLWQGQLPAGIGPVQITATVVGVAVAAHLLWTTGASLWQALRTQRRHRQLLALVGRADPAAPGALVLDHPHAAAYCLPGLRPTVVISAGTLALLRRPELAAVLEHERAHATERHDLVLLPFTALRRAFPIRRWLCRVAEAVALLVEMRADDRARRRHPDAWLAAALHRFAGTSSPATPAGALGIVDPLHLGPGPDPALALRMQRLTQRRRPPRLAGALTLAGTGLLAVAPVALFTLPLLPG